MSAGASRTLHKWLAILWACVTPPICIAFFIFRDHPLMQVAGFIWVTFVSHYANFATHWGAYQASRTEVKVEEDS